MILFVSRPEFVFYLINLGAPVFSTALFPPRPPETHSSTLTSLRYPQIPPRSRRLYKEVKLKTRYITFSAGLRLEFSYLSQTLRHSGTSGSPWAPALCCQMSKRRESTDRLWGWMYKGQGPSEKGATPSCCNSVFCRERHTRNHQEKDRNEAKRYQWALSVTLKCWRNILKHTEIQI